MLRPFILPYSPKCVEYGFCEIRLSGVLGSSHPGIMRTPSLCGRNSYVEIKGSWPCLHKALSGAGDGSERTSPLRSSKKVRQP